MSINLKTEFGKIANVRSSLEFVRDTVEVSNLIVTKGFGLQKNFGVTIGFGGFKGFVYVKLLNLKTSFAQMAHVVSGIGKRMRTIKLFSGFYKAISKKTTFNTYDMYMGRVISIVKKIYLWCGKIKGK